MRYLLSLLMYEFILIPIMCTWPELHTCILINLLISYIKKNKQTTTKKRQNKINLLDSPNLDKIQEKLSKTNNLIVSLLRFSFFFFFFFFKFFLLPWNFWPQLVCKYASFAFLVYLWLYFKANMSSPSYGLITKFPL